MLGKQIAWIVAGLGLLQPSDAQARRALEPPLATCQAPATARRVVASPPPRVQVITGVAAERRLAKARAGHPAMHRAFEESEQRFVARKMKRIGVTVLVFGQRSAPRPTSIPGRILGWIVPTLLAQVVYDDGGEVYISDWDDGDHATWEGSVYAIDYQSQGHYATDSQVYVADETFADVLWDYGWIASPPVGDDNPAARSAPPRVARVAMNNAACDCGYINGWGRCALRRALDEAWPTCAAAGLWCLATPSYFICAGGACYISIFQRYLTNIRDSFGECYQR